MSLIAYVEVKNLTTLVPNGGWAHTGTNFFIICETVKVPI